MSEAQKHLMLSELDLGLGRNLNQTLGLTLCQRPGRAQDPTGGAASEAQKHLTLYELDLGWKRKPSFNALLARRTPRARRRRRRRST